jgi:hypothetical protein
VADEQAGRLIRLGVAALAAVTSAFACSRVFGAGGTLVGTGVGAIVSGTAAELYGRVAVKAKHHIRAVPAWRQWNYTWPQLSGRLVAELAAGGLVVAVAAYGTVYGIEKVAGRPLSAVTTGSDVRGNSFTGSTPYTSPAAPGPSVVPTVDPSVPLASPTPDASVVTSSAAPDRSPTATETTGPPDEPTGSPEFQAPPPAGTPVVTSSP